MSILRQGRSLAAARLTVQARAPSKSANFGMHCIHGYIRDS